MNQDLLTPTKVEIFNRQPTCGPPPPPSTPTPLDPLVKKIVNFNVFLEGKWRHMFDSKI